MKWWFVMDLKHNMLCEYGINERRCHIFKWIWVPLLPLPYTIRLASSSSSSLCCFSVQLFWPLCVLCCLYTHSALSLSLSCSFVRSLTHSLSTFRVSTRSHTLNADENTHNTSSFTCIYAFILSVSFISFALLCQDYLSHSLPRSLLHLRHRRRRRRCRFFSLFSIFIFPFLLRYLCRSVHLLSTQRAHLSLTNVCKV